MTSPPDDTFDTLDAKMKAVRGLRARRFAPDRLATPSNPADRVALETSGPVVGRAPDGPPRRALAPGPAVRIVQPPPSATDLIPWACYVVVGAVVWFLFLACQDPFSAALGWTLGGLPSVLFLFFPFLFGPGNLLAVLLATLIWLTASRALARHYRDRRTLHSWSRINPPQ